VGVGLPGCGTIFHSERVGQPHSRDIDWKIVALNGLGLALFFIPGVIAFVVDFSTGAIYLPPEHPPYAPPGANQPPGGLTRTSGTSAELGIPRPAAIEGPGISRTPPRVTSNMRRITLPPHHLVPGNIETAVRSHTDRRFSLADRSARVSLLRKLDGYDDQCLQHQRDDRFGFSAQAFFGRLRHV